MTAGVVPLTSTTCTSLRRTPLRSGCNTADHFEAALATAPARTALNVALGIIGHLLHANASGSDVASIHYPLIAYTCGLEPLSAVRAVVRELADGGMAPFAETVGP